MNRRPPPKAANLKASFPCFLVTKPKPLTSIGPNIIGSLHFTRIELIWTAVWRPQSLCAAHALIKRPAHVDTCQFHRDSWPDVKLAGLVKLEFARSRKLKRLPSPRPPEVLTPGGETLAPIPPV